MAQPPRRMLAYVNWNITCVFNKSCLILFGDTLFSDQIATNKNFTRPPIVADGRSVTSDINSCKEACGCYLDSAWEGHVHRENRPFLPLHCSWSQKLAGPSIGGKLSANDEHSDVVEPGSSRVMSWHSHTSQPSFLPVLVVWCWVEHQAGISMAPAGDGVTTTGYNQGAGDKYFFLDINNFLINLPSILISIIWLIVRLNCR